MAQLFRAGIYEYEKRKIVNMRPCAECGKDIPTRGGKKCCLSCYDVRLQRNLVAARKRRKAAREGA